ncbi:DUF3105 domain-containing protein [Kribbella catacumbae]|uniref:DUF3105 domain-containing protein n=1 Tax=Kribbella catacumbae TaxID=460086 RepID=UPI00036F737C|nr:DUF3105 domain-containing protein [Kribbella catacumbae]
MSKSKSSRDRRQLIEQMQRSQAQADRRRTIMVVVASVVVGLAIIAYPAIRIIQESRAKDASAADLGVAAQAASCDPVIEDKTAGNLDHKPDGTPLKFAVSPPSSGPHYQVPAPFQRKFYTAEDRPNMGNLVHNLEHGYTILWYRESVAGDKAKIDTIERIAKTYSASDLTGKFVAAPYKADDGGPAWPEGKNFALSHWGGGEPATQKGYRQFCGDISGAAVKDFTDRYPASDSPEPNAG